MSDAVSPVILRVGSLDYSSVTMGRTAGRSMRWRPGSGRARLMSRRGHPWPRTVPASMLPGAELIHLGGGETLPCPDVETLPLDPAVAHGGLGTARLALPPARLHVLPGALVMPGNGVVATAHGRVVAESVTAAMVAKVPLDGSELRARPDEVDGTVAVFRSPLRSEYHTLVDDLPRAGLLIHPAVGRLGNITLLHDGPLTDLEEALLAHMGGRRVRLRQVQPGRPVHADRVVVPNFVTRPGAGAVPSWYRRWSDRVALPEVRDAPRRVFIDAAVPDSDPGGGALSEVLGRHGFASVPAGSCSVPELMAVLRDAEVIVGRDRDSLAGSLFSRSAHVVELLDGTVLDPAIYYLAVSKGLPYHFVPASGSDGRPGTAESVLDLEALDGLLDRITR